MRRRNDATDAPSPDGEESTDAEQDQLPDDPVRSSQGEISVRGHEMDTPGGGRTWRREHLRSRRG